jgi:hypothetical protein
MSSFNKGQRNSSYNSNSNNNKSHFGDDDQNKNAATRRARDATLNIQNDTQAALARTLAAATETNELGATTLDELYQQRKTLERTQEAGDRLNAQLDTTEKLQNTLSRLGGWNHWGQKSVAKKQVKQEEKREQQTQAQRKAQVEESMTKKTESSPSHDPVVIVEKKKKKSLLGRKKEKLLPVVNVSAADRKALGSSTYGLGKNNNNNNNRSNTADGNKNNNHNNHNDPEHDEFLRRVEATDHEIDAGLNAVDTQLDQLLNLATNIKDEVHVQSSVLEHVDDQLQTANQKQKVAAHRMKRFF